MYTIGVPGGYFVGFNKKTGNARFRNTTQCKLQNLKPKTFVTRVKAENALEDISNRLNDRRIYAPFVRQVRWDNSLITVK